MSKEQKFRAKILVKNTGQRFERTENGIVWGLSNISFFVEQHPNSQDATVGHQLLSWEGTDTQDPIIFLLKRALEDAYWHGFCDGCAPWEKKEDDLSGTS